MLLTQATRLQFTEDLNICRILNGMWQMSGYHGRINSQKAIQDMFKYLDAGYTTWDLADHYGSAEDLIGEFYRQLKNQRGEAAKNSLQAFTKWVPRPGKMTRQVVEDNINISLRRMDVDCLDLIQFHWWEYQDPRYLDALHHLADLQQAGKIKHLALTNFDTERLKIITEAGITIVSNQVQFSIIDRRPQVEMIDYCRENNIQLLCYGTLGGGLISNNYLGKKEPLGFQLNTASLKKYKNMINAWGGWDLLQEMLTTLQEIATKYNVSIANIAVRYVLEQPTVAGAIIGARLSIAEHLEDNARVFSFNLDETDYQKIDTVSNKSRDLYQLIGDCGDEYRR